MSTIVVGASDAAATLSRTLAEAGLKVADGGATDADPGAGSVASLAGALGELGRTIEASPPSCVVLADDSDRSLAAALVATKLLIPVAATSPACSARSSNGRLIAQLADAKASDPAAIAAWSRTATAPPAAEV